MESRIDAYSPEWFKERQGMFTGSQLYRLMSEPRTIKAKEAGDLSEGANTYVLEKVWETLSGETIQGINNFATEWGNEQEPNAKKWYAKITGNQVTDAPLVYRDDFKGLIGTPDGFVGEDGMVEIKCPWNGSNHLKHCFITTDDYFRKEHDNYWWQIQCYLFLTNRMWCDFVSFDPRIDSQLGMFVYRVEAIADDFELIEKKVGKALVVYNEYLKLFSK
jgi:exodeoxyribonuclease (lambda-induced)